MLQKRVQFISRSSVCLHHEKIRSTSLITPPLPSINRHFPPHSFPTNPSATFFAAVLSIFQC